MCKLAAFASFSIAMKLFDWLRLFESTAFYINLIGQTVADIKSFIILLLASMLLFGLPKMMLDFYSTHDTELFYDHTGNLFTNMMMNQYLVTLGDFHIKHYMQNEETLISWVLFILATGFTQITMLNMLIAIMGDTFDKVSESKQVFTTRTKL